MHLFPPSRLVGCSVAKLGNNGELFKWAYTHDKAWRIANRPVRRSKQRFSFVHTLLLWPNFMQMYAQPSQCVLEGLWCTSWM